MARKLRSKYERIITEFGECLVSKTGYYYFYPNGNSKKSKRLHVAIYEKYIGSVPDKWHVHHKDENKKNNDPSNLIALSSLDHLRVHCGWIKTDGQWTHKRCSICKELKTLSDFRRGSPDSTKRYETLCKPCQATYRTKWRQSRRAKGLRVT